MAPAKQTAVPMADEISRADLDAALSRYPAVVEAVAATKAHKPGQKTLQALDRYRYVDAPRAFAPAADADQPPRAMGLDDVKLLVEWKLRHGTFRPTLMSLVASNAPALVQRTVQEALRLYRDSSSAADALAVLCALRGIGPATASLLLAVHDPARALFFSDEAFRWLCRGGDARAPIRYTPAEYRALSERADAVARRLGVGAVELEKAAYVLMRGPGPSVVASAHQKGPAKAPKPTPKPASAGGSKSSSTKRGRSSRPVESAADDAADDGVRRSKRLRTRTGSR
ncbi:hypothetical protein CDD83_2945 [Cordyceps sp. RAO-2017]|nr:hypothetical protein CDD83_2945 [Cordyceps sp. RAO-2017]